MPLPPHPDSIAATAGRPVVDMVDTATAAIDRLIADWTRRYGEVVCTVVARRDDGEGAMGIGATSCATPIPAIRLAGAVLIDGQRRAIVDAVTAVVAGASSPATTPPAVAPPAVAPPAVAPPAVAPPAVVDAIDVLVARPEHLGWAVPSGGVLDVCAKPGGDLATQLVPGDPPARRLARRGDWWAVELADATLGWARDADLVDAPKAIRPADVASWRADFAGAGRDGVSSGASDHPLGVETIESGDGDAVDPAAWRRAVEPWLGTPYVWGGNAPTGIDCSGLTQRVIRSVLGVGLPKHSRDQIQAGRRVALSEVRPGDLLHLTHKRRGIGHVAIVIDTDPEVMVAHASFDANAVVVEPLTSMRARYTIRGVRRYDSVDRGAAIGPLSASTPVAYGATVSSPASTAPSDIDHRASPAWPPDLAARWAALRALADRDVHVVGLASTEGAAVVRFLWSEGVRRITVHDFQPADKVEAAFRRMHVGMPAAERDRIWREIAALPIERRFGERYLSGIDEAQAIFAGQAWYLYAPNLPKLADLRAAGVPFAGITDLYFELSPAPILAVTGSNGKSTTSRLVEAILRQPDRRVYYAGNERRSVQVLDTMRGMRADDWLVLEVSNRQLIDLAPPRPRIAVVTNVLPNHLDEHGGTFEAYAAVKRKLVEGQGAGDRAVLNADNDATRAMADGLAGEVYWFSRTSPVTRGAWLGDDGHIWLRADPAGPAVDAGPIAAARIPGAHNQSNILAAALAAWLAGADVDDIQRGIGTFRGLRHRTQLVWSAGGVRYYDDLNSTTPQATVAALDALDGAPTVLIAGGDDKGLDLGDLAWSVATRARRLILLPGTGSDRIEAAVRAASAGAGDGAGPEIARFDRLPDAVADAVASAHPGDAVLLSPACPYFFRMHYLDGSDREVGFRALLRDILSHTPEAT